jgi:hypothetical protein
MLRPTLHCCVLALSIVACGSPQGLEADQFPDRYNQAVSASGGTAPVASAGSGGSGGSANLGGTSGAGGSSSTGGSGSRANGGSGGTGSAGTGSAGGSGGTGGGQAGTSGAGGAGGGSQSTGACPDDITVLFKRMSAQGGCGDAGCHSASGLPPDLVSPNVEMRLLNVQSTCQGRPYIGATDSFLLEKIEDMSPACGSQMPFLATQNLSAADRQCIADWIDDVGGGG